MFRELQAATCKLDQYVSCLINSRREITGALLEKIVVAFLLEDKVTDSLKAVMALCFFTKQCFEKECSFKSCPVYNLSQLEWGPEKSWQHNQITQISLIKKLVIIPRQNAPVTSVNSFHEGKQNKHEGNGTYVPHYTCHFPQPSQSGLEFLHTIDTQSN